MKPADLERVNALRALVLVHSRSTYSAAVILDRFDEEWFLQDLLRYCNRWMLHVQTPAPAGAIMMDASFVLSASMQTELTKSFEKRVAVVSGMRDTHQHLAYAMEALCAYRGKVSADKLEELVVLYHTQYLEKLKADHDRQHELNKLDREHDHGMEMLRTKVGFDSTRNMLAGANSWARTLFVLAAIGAVAYMFLNSISKSPEFVGPSRSDGAVPTSRAYHDASGQPSGVMPVYHDYGRNPEPPSIRSGHSGAAKTNWSRTGVIP